MENFIKEVEVDGVSHSITLGDNMVGPGLKKDENGVVSLDINEEKLVKITYSELKSLRDNSQLVQGSFYRITDYMTMTTQLDTKSANHPFDVIVLALSENTLSEDAKAALHESDTYFADSDLSAWELKYCLDNDKTRFGWADKTNGKGVIYRMVDENHNDCPYDFKNILFFGNYTFLNGHSDASIESYPKPQYNIIHRTPNALKMVIFNIDLLEKCQNNSVGAYSEATFISPASDNIIEDSCTSCQIIKSDNNIIRKECSNIIISDYSGNIIKSHNHRLIIKSSHSVVEEHFNDGEKVLNVLKDGTIYTSSVQYGENFYDDGSGQLVPIKHPDLSTQPSILPYKFMGLYVYEQLIPVNLETYNDFYIGSIRLDSLLNFSKRNGMVLSAYVITTIKMTSSYEDSEYECRIPINAVVTIATKYYDNVGYTGVIQVAFKIDEDSYKLMSGVSPEINTDKAIVKIIYTSMPEEGGDYYGYEQSTESANTYLHIHFNTPPHQATCADLFIDDVIVKSYEEGEAIPLNDLKGLWKIEVLPGLLNSRIIGYGYSLLEAATKKIEIFPEIRESELREFFGNDYLTKGDLHFYVDVIF